ncbi:organic solute transporter Ostalpha-domain-containing protein [Mariannaea sp. PMI_226]|nr:organic solute transporter Ostalpha-domain-containing protein [Mariannaea sp. PMI_226]
MAPQCNQTLEDMSLPDDQATIIGNFTFNQTARILGGISTAVAVLVSVYLIFRHALSYTKPREQRQIIRIAALVPIYALASYLQICFYTHAVYIGAISSLYEAVALAAFFSLICHYVAPDLHSQKNFFREMTPIQGWIIPVSWLSKCTGGQRGPFRVPRSGLTWFNIIWVCVYQYCFIRTAMTFVSVFTEAAGKYCESSNNPAFAHIWVTLIELVSLVITMFNLIQFYFQLKKPLAEYKPLTKFIAIKLVVFLSVIQTSIISLVTSHVDTSDPKSKFANGDIKVGIPNLLLCIEMACFAIFHLFAFPHQPYHPGAKPTFYPAPDASRGGAQTENRMQSPSGGFLGFGAILDAINVWDFFKAVVRGFRWVFVGAKNRQNDISYQAKLPVHQDDETNDSELAHMGNAQHPLQPQSQEYVSMTSPPPQYHGQYSAPQRYEQYRGEEGASLVYHAQPEPYDPQRFRQTPSPSQQPLHSGYGGMAYRSG